MGTSTSFAQAAAKMGKVAKIIDGAPKTAALHAVGKEGKRIVSNVYERDMGGNLSLSNWKGSTVAVGYDFVGSDAVAFKPRDRKGGIVLRVLEEGAGDHRIARKRRGNRRRGRGRPTLLIGGSFVGSSVLWRHRARGGKEPWHQSLRAMRREEWARYFDREYAKALAAVF